MKYKTYSILLVDIVSILLINFWVCQLAAPTVSMSRLSTRTTDPAVDIIVVLYTVLSTFDYNSCVHVLCSCIWYVGYWVFKSSAQWII